MHLAVSTSTFQPGTGDIPYFSVLDRTHIHDLEVSPLTLPPLQPGQFSDVDREAAYSRLAFPYRLKVVAMNSLADVIKKPNLNIFQDNAKG